MKLTDLAIEGYSVSRNLLMSRFNDGLNIVFGQTGSGKSTIRQFIRGVLFGFGSANTPPGGFQWMTPGDRETAAGGAPRNIPVEGRYLDFSRDQSHYRAYRDPITNAFRYTPLEGHLNSTSNPGAFNTMTQPGEMPEWSRQIPVEIYDTLFNVGFMQTDHLGEKLSRALTSFVGVETGSQQREQAAYEQWQREQESVRAEISLVETTLATLTTNRVELERRLEQSNTLRISQLQAIESQLATLAGSIAAIRTQPMDERISALTAEINRLRTAIHEAETRVEVQPVVAAARTTITTPAPNQHVSTLYFRLDEIESQISRWRHVQKDIQQYRVQLRDEMLKWNTVSLESEQHPYHTAREILAALENKVVQARDRLSIPVENEAANATASAELYDRMQKDIYSLCNELGSQYKLMRHKTAAAELKQLRHCYDEMGESITRLVQRRKQVIEEIQKLDPAGAELILRADEAFCRCARHDGYLQARKRFGGRGPETRVAVPETPTVEYRRVAIDTTAQRRQLAELETELSLLTRRYEDSHGEMLRLKTEHADLNSRRDALNARAADAQLIGELEHIRTEIEQSNRRLSHLHSQLDSAKPIESREHPLIGQASNLLTQISLGDLAGVWLDSAGAGVTNGHLTGTIMTRDRYGKHVPFASLTRGQQDLTYLSLSLAAVENLRERGIEAPLLLDDLFANLDPQRAGAVMNAIREAGLRRMQIFVFADHHEIPRPAASDAVTVFELPQTTVSPAPYVQPGRHTFTEPTQPRIDYPESVVPQTTLTVHTPQAYARRLPAVGVDFSSTPVSLQRAQSQRIGSHAQYIQQVEQKVTHSPVDSRPYPLSKYPRNDQPVGEVLSIFEENTFKGPVHRTGSPETGIDTRSRRQRVTVESTAAAHPVQTIRTGQTVRTNHETVPAVSGSSSISAIGISESSFISALAEYGIRTLDDLLNANPDTLDASLTGSGISMNLFDRWQSRAWLMICVPQLNSAQAALLVACGVTEPEHIDTTHSNQLYERIQRFLATPDSRGHADTGRRISSETINHWYRGLDTTRSLWRSENGYSRLRRSGRSRSQNRSNNFSDRHNHSSTDHGSANHGSTNRGNGSREYSRQPRPSIDRAPRAARTNRRSRDNTTRQRRESDSLATPMVQGFNERQRSSSRPKRATTAKSSRSTASTGKSGVRKLKFYLDLSDHIEAAPSIGPKTAEKFEKIGVRTIEEFLTRNADSMAAKIDYKKMTADVIRAWQHQARLVCRIPNLRGHDAQLLVACELTDPEKIAGMPPSSLFAIIDPFSSTKEGLKIIRNGKRPDLDEIKDWISWATEHRSLRAA